MVIRGATRGNGKQLAEYLTRQGENERVHILDVDGNTAASQKDLQDRLTAWSLMSELTKSNQGLYHAVINPAYGFDKKMTAEEWNRAADILAKETGYEGQSRAIVLHEKNGRTHAHVVFERYDHEKEKMLSNSFNRLAQDRAREKMEKALEHEATPKRNRHRPELKQEMSDLWHSTKDGLEFLSACAARDYIITRTAQRRSFSVVDKDGISYDLPRQIKGVRTKEVAERLAGMKLKTNKEAIQEIRAKQSAKSFDQVQQKAQDLKDKFQQAEAVKQEAETFAKAKGFSDNRGDMFGKKPQPKKDKPQGKTEKLANAFAASRDDMFAEDQEAKEKAAKLKEEQERLRKLEEFKKKLERMKSNSKGLEL
jgi:hypothetical protein